MGRLGSDLTDELLFGTGQTDAFDAIHSQPDYQPPGRWFKSGSNVKFKSQKDMLAAVDRAAEYIEQV
jgi:hypothetical protein